MRTIAIVLILIFNCTMFSQAQKELVIGEQPVYKVAKAKGPIAADGKMDEEAWKNAEVVTFDYFFRRDEPLEKQKTDLENLEKYTKSCQNGTIYVRNPFGIATESLGESSPRTVIIRASIGVLDRFRSCAISFFGL